MQNWELVNFCELDKYAIDSYCAIHKVNKALNLGDVTKVNENNLAEFTMLCGGSPCQDFSASGKQKGVLWECADCGYSYNPIMIQWNKRNTCPECNSVNIKKTRSSLLIEYLRLLRTKHPKFAIYENVKNITSKGFSSTFAAFLNEIDSYGYNVYWKILNAKGFGIPQNRERVYVIMIDKTLDNKQFAFPQEIDMGIRLKDILEDSVDSKYNLSGVNIDTLLQSVNTKNKSYAIRKLTPIECLKLMGFTSKDYKEMRDVNISDSQIYKQIGNSIVVDVLYYIYTELYKVMPYLFEDLRLLSLFSGIGAFEKALTLFYEDKDKSCFKKRVENVKENYKLIKMGNIYKSKGQNGNIYSIEGISPTISSGVTDTAVNRGIGSNNAPKIVYQLNTTFS